MKIKVVLFKWLCYVQVNERMQNIKVFNKINNF